MTEFSLSELQNVHEDGYERSRKNNYASDFGKCPSGIYYEWLGEEPTSDVDPESIRRMQIGTLVEKIQIDKLKDLGIYLSAQERIYDKEYDVSGRPDAILIDPNNCTQKSKRLINEKIEIRKKIKESQKSFWRGFEKRQDGEITSDEFLEGKIKLEKRNHDLYEQDFELSRELLKPLKSNKIIVAEIKSISDWGFKYKSTEGPTDTHVDQTMFYYWKLREQYPNIEARILYVNTTWQTLKEFKVKYEADRIKKLQGYWSMMNKAIKEKKPPVSAPSIIQNTKTGKWQVNWAADWCQYHIKCTGDANWKEKAFEEARQKNGEKKTIKI